MQCVVDAAGFREPAPIRQKIIPLILDGMDLIAQVQTGTGTTAEFALPIHLIRKLIHMNIQPYCVYQHDMVKGVEELRTPWRKIRSWNAVSAERWRGSTRRCL